jgi:hypothetical protein
MACLRGDVASDADDAGMVDMELALPQISSHNSAGCGSFQSRAA